MERRNSLNGEIRIRISGLSNGLHEYHFSVTPSDIELDEHFPSSVEVDAHLDKASRQLYLKTAIRTTGSFECDRCLDPFEQQLSTRYTMFYIYDELESGKFPEDEVQIINPDTVCLELAEDVRQFVLLSVPLKLLCKEDCKGLCSNCGTNWNHGPCDCKREIIDSRWSGLQNLMKQ